MYVYFIREKSIPVEILKFRNSDTSSDYVRLHKSLGSWKNTLSLLSPFLLALPTFFSDSFLFFSLFICASFASSFPFTLHLHFGDVEK